MTRFGAPSALQLLLLVVVFAVMRPQPAEAQPHKPCSLVTNAEAESIVGASLVVYRSTNDECWYRENGFTTPGAPHDKQVYVDIWRHDRPQPDDVSTTRANIADRQPGAVIKDLPGFADAALWSWMPGAGRLTAFKGGTIGVDVMIGGIAEAAALRHAKALAGRILGGTGRTGFVYRASGAPDEQAHGAAGGETSCPPGVADKWNYPACLQVCNKSRFTIIVASAVETDMRPIIPYFWAIRGTPLAAGACDEVYRDTTALPAYLGFGFKDPRGLWGSATLDRLPDMGGHHVEIPLKALMTGSTEDGAVLTKRDERTLCISQNAATFYRSPSAPAGGCAGAQVPVSASLYFRPNGARCHMQADGVNRCTGGSYELDISSAGGRALQASVSEGGTPAKPQSQPQTAHPGSRFLAACRAWYDDPQNARFRVRNAEGYCTCLTAQYQFVMTPEQEAYYAADYGGRFRSEILQPQSTDPAWPRLHPAAVNCMQ